jgi:hypothetical protein
MMDATPGEKPPPESTDLEGWRQAIAKSHLPAFRLEALVAALQDLGPTTDAKVRNALAKHLSDSMIKMLRKHVGFNHRNQGEDIIYRVHEEMFEALLEPHSADGKALRAAFGPRVLFRVKDAISVENRHGRIPVEGKVKVARKGLKPGDDTFTEIIRTTGPGKPPEPANDMNLSDGEDAGPNTANRDLSLLDGVRDLDEQIDVARLLALVTDDRKRLAFYLHMDRVPYKSKKWNSIAKAINKSSETAKDWVEEVQELLKLDKEVQELQNSRMGDTK